MGEPRIKTRCPSCGHDTLFVPEHGLLTCSWIGCKKPAAINDIAVEFAVVSKELGVAIRAAADLAAQNQARKKEIERLDHWKAVADEGRQAGREEALQIVLAEDPEDLFTDAMRSHAAGETGEWATTWDEQRLREKFDVQPGATQSIIERADILYWSTRDEVDNLKAALSAAQAKADVLGGEWCRKNRSEGRGPCGACALCVKEATDEAMRLRADAAKDAECVHRLADRLASTVRKSFYITNDPHDLEATDRRAESAAARVTSECSVVNVDGTWRRVK